MATSSGARRPLKEQDAKTGNQNNQQGDGFGVAKAATIPLHQHFEHKPFHEPNSGIAIPNCIEMSQKDFAFMADYAK